MAASSDMDWFDDFNLIELKTKTDGILGEKECEHNQTELVDGSDVCLECGMCMATLSFDKEWRYYGAADTKNLSDPARCHKRRKDQRSIYKVIEGHGIPEAIVADANEKYKVIIEHAIFRGERRMSIIVACLFHAYMDHGEPRTASKLGKLFKLSEKKVNDGINTYYEFFPDARKKQVTAQDLIKGIMIDVGVNMSHYRKINRLCEYLNGRSSTLNRSTPQSVAAAIVYLHLCLLPEYKESLGMNKLRFSKMVGLSDITIGKLARDAASIIDSGIKI